MAKVKLNSMLKEVRGKMGDVVFRTTANGKSEQRELGSQSKYFHIHVPRYPNLPHL